MAWNYRVIKAKNVIGYTGMGPVIRAGEKSVCWRSKLDCMLA